MPHIPTPAAPRLLATAALLAGLAAAPAHAGLGITTDTDIAAARTTFLSQATVLGAYDWSSLFAPGAHVFGVGGPIANYHDASFVASDGAVNFVHTVNGHPQSLSLANWVDGPGFDSLDSTQAAADLAINGVESFDLAFGAAYRSVGLAISTGESNFANQTDLLGASFEFTALDSTGHLIGSASMSLPAGAPARAWVTLVATDPIYRLQVREINQPSLMDQYFSNIYATPAVVAAVPEPAGAWLLAAGLLGLAGLKLRRRR